LILKTVYYDLAPAKQKVQHWKEVEIFMLMKLVLLFIKKKKKKKKKKKEEEEEKEKEISSLVSLSKITLRFEV
jgi:predicted peroxiredoxin